MDLREADLTDANLSSADLRRTNVFQRLYPNILFREVRE